MHLCLHWCVNKSYIIARVLVIIQRSYLMPLHTTITTCSIMHYSPDLVAKGMLQLLLQDKSKVGAAMMIRPKDRISYFAFVGEPKAKL